MSTTAEFGRGKTIFVLAIVIGCFAVLWPKIFYPMLTASLSQTQGDNGPLKSERPFRPGPELIHPGLRERNRALPTMNIPRRTIEREARPGPLPGMRPPVGAGAGHIPTGPKGGGTMGIIMPMYTIGIVCFFLYTIMKILFKKNPPEGEQPPSVKPQVKDYGMDPEHRKYVFSEEYTQGSERSMRDSLNKQDRDMGLRRRSVRGKANRFYEDRRRLGNRERDARDVEIEILRKKLEETEAAMEQIVARMGSVSDQISPSVLSQVLRAKGECMERLIAATEAASKAKEDLAKESSESPVKNLRKIGKGRKSKEVRFKSPQEELEEVEEDDKDSFEEEYEEDSKVLAEKEEEEESKVQAEEEDSKLQINEEEKIQEEEIVQPPPSQPPPTQTLTKKKRTKAEIKKAQKLKLANGNGKSTGKKSSNASSPDMDEYEVIWKATDATKDASPRVEEKTVGKEKLVPNNGEE